MDLHVLLTDGNNLQSLTKDTIHISEVGPNGEEYIALKDGFGDSLNFHDELTDDIERFKKSFIDVNKNVIWPSEPRIVFAVSDKTSNIDMLKELNEKFKSSTKIKPMKEIIQLNETRVELIPMVTADRVYTELRLTNYDSSMTLKENVQKLLTIVWNNYDKILLKIVDVYKALSNLIIENTEYNVKQYVNTLTLDIEIIKTKIKIDLLTESLANVDYLELKYAWNDLDLRNFKTTDVFSVKLGSLNRMFGRYYILQTTSSTSDNLLSSAMIEVLSGYVIDFIQGSNKDNGVTIIPDDLLTNTPKVYLRGGRKYRIFRTPNTTSTTLTYIKESDSILDKVKTAPPSYRLTEFIHTDNNHMVLESKGILYRIELTDQ
ncbi:MAG: hypothetical protein ACRCX2_13585 [Paraclostridium sp.]